MRFDIDPPSIGRTDYICYNALDGGRMDYSRANIKACPGLHS